MSTKDKLFISLGLVSLLFTCFVLLMNKADWLLIPAVQGAIGFIIASMIIASIRAFREKRKTLAIFFLFVTILQSIIIVNNNNMSLDGAMMVLFLWIIVGLQIIIISTMIDRKSHKNKLY